MKNPRPDNEVCARCGAPATCSVTPTVSGVRLALCDRCDTRYENDLREEGRGYVLDEYTEECGDCGCEIPLRAADAPPLGDDAAWEKMLRWHACECDWVRTRAHQIPDGAEEQVEVAGVRCQKKDKENVGRLMARNESSWGQALPTPEELNEGEDGEAE